MRILIYSRAFLPQVGGLESAVAHLAEGLALRGHEVVLITTTPGGSDEALPYRVLRNPGATAFLYWMRWCDLFHHPNVSLRGFWPLLLVRRPWVVSHHSWYRRPDGRIAWQDRLKRALLPLAKGSISVSQAIADDLPVPSTVIGNAYRDSLFRIVPEVARTQDLVFVGRLVSDKGADILLEALGMLAAKGLSPGLAMVGEGPERPALESQARRLGLARSVKYLGVLTGEPLVETLNRHRILVVPSRYREPFGIVALEGIACGCVVVGSHGGGLRDAVGPCGRTFPNGDIHALAQCLEQLLRDPGAQAVYRGAAGPHLRAHSADAILDRYLAVFADALRGGR